MSHVAPCPTTEQTTHNQQQPSIPTWILGITAVAAGYMLIVLQ